MHNVQEIKNFMIFNLLLTNYKDEFSNCKDLIIVLVWNKSFLLNIIKVLIIDNELKKFSFFFWYKFIFLKKILMINL